MVSYRIVIASTGLTYLSTFSQVELQGAELSLINQGIDYIVEVE